MNFLEELLKEDNRPPTEENEIDISEIAESVALKLTNQLKTEIESIRNEITNLKNEKEIENYDNNNKEEQRNNKERTVHTNEITESSVD